MQLATSGLALQRVAAHNHNLLRDGEIVGSLVRVPGNVERRLCWRLDVDIGRVGPATAERFERPVHEFGSFAAAAYWLGVV